MTVITRFAPSPTGFLHIGGARTALFNYLFAKRHGGKFLLRIEDTDRERSTDAAIEAILDGLSWLGLKWDDDVTYQFARANRHAEVAKQMVEAGHAYYCYCSPEELEEMRARAQAEGKGFRYDGRWRERDVKEAPAGVKPVIRLKAPLEGEITIRDHVQGEVTVQCAQLDDMVLLRSDGTPTYMLAVVVDDHDMHITHVIRGDDHFTNAFRQTLIYRAMGWNVPEFAHIPLIHGADGAKLSKRHGALGVEAYRDMGYLPEALRNYLLRLGWSHGDEEIISDADAVAWFGLDHVGKSPSRFDFTKLENVNGHYLREAEDARLVTLTIPLLGALGHMVDETGRTRLEKGMAGLKARAKTLVELAHAAAFYVAKRPLQPDEKAAALLDSDARALLRDLAAFLEKSPEWKGEALEALIREYTETKGVKLGKAAQPLRAALTGSATSPPIFEVMEVLGREETLERLGDIH